MRAALAGLAALALLASGCATQLAVPALQPSPPPTEAPVVAEEWPGPDPEPDPGARPRIEYRDEVPACEPGATFAVAFVGYDAALGSRFHFARVRNCTDEALPLPAPGFTGLDHDGATVDLNTEDRSADPPALAPDADVLLELKWLSNGRCERGVQELTMRLGGEEFVSPEHCLQLGGGFAPERDADISFTWPTP